MRLDHIGIACENLAAVTRLYQELFGLELKARETRADLDVTVQKLSTGNTVIELLEPRGEGGAIRKFLDRRGPGIHHLCFEVADVRAASAALQTRGLRTVWPEPRPGADGALVQFLHPESSGGVLIELSQPGGAPAGGG